MHTWGTSQPRHRKSHVGPRSRIDTPCPFICTPSGISRRGIRVEVLSDAKDKARGGNDFQAVVNVARKGGAEALLKLYKKSDRLRPLLEERKPPPPVGVSNGSLRPVTYTGDRIRESDYHTPEVRWTLDFTGFVNFRID